MKRGKQITESGSRAGTSPYALLLLMLGWVLLSGCSDGESAGEAQATSTVANALVESGELSAVTTKSFVMPRFRRWNSIRVIGLEEHGKQIDKGDSIIQLDPSEMTKYIVQRETDLESQHAALEKLLVAQDNRESEAEATIKSELAAYELSKLQHEASRFESERAKKISELQFQQATIRLNIARKRMELNKIINENDLKIAQIRVEQIKNDIANTYDLIDQLTIRSTTNGILQLQRNRRTGQLLCVGDEVYRGYPMACVPDLTWMKVETCINEHDFLRIAKGQQVLVRLDALPEVAFKGEVAHIGLFCHLRNNNNPREKVFDVTVRLLDSDERLKPGMTVSCEYIEALP